ncbi:MAG: hypothetical protein KKE84_14050 [Gammaproteobacteria bacterium]|nr:hypothetical protein [Gammaproteobacteria bacterium]
MSDELVINLDKLTYGGNLENLVNSTHFFVRTACLKAGAHGAPYNFR